MKSPVPIPCFAKIAKRKISDGDENVGVGNDAADHPVVPVASHNQSKTESISEHETVSEPESTIQPVTRPESPPHLDVPPPSKLGGIKTPEPTHSSAAFAKSELVHESETVGNFGETSHASKLENVSPSEIAFPPMALKERQLEERFTENYSKFPSQTPVINLDVSSNEAPVVEEERDWGARLKSANSDRRILARFFALVLCIVAVVNMVPAIYHWYHWLQLTESMALPRWIYIQIFVGAIHLVYAVFLAQIPDWSAMRAVSVAMLIVAFVFGFVSTGLLIGGGEGNLTGFLGIPYALSRQACIWCVAMLCLATLMSYWGGKESGNWQRAEYLLKGIASRSAA